MDKPTIILISCALCACGPLLAIGILFSALKAEYIARPIYEVDTLLELSGLMATIGMGWTKCGSWYCNSDGEEIERVITWRPYQNRVQLVSMVCTQTWSRLPYRAKPIETCIEILNAKGYKCKWTGVKL